MLKFEWDGAKAQSNPTKHGVSFEEAASVFGNPPALTFPYPEHSIGINKDEIRTEYKREELGKGVRGKYHVRFTNGSNLVLLEGCPRQKAESRCSL